MSGRGEGPRTPAGSCRAAFSPPRPERGWVVLPIDPGQHSPAPEPAPEATGWRVKSLSHPSVLTPKPCFSFLLISTVSFVCAGRGVGAGGAGREPRSTAGARARAARVSLKEFSDVYEVVLVLLGFVAQCWWMDGWVDVIHHLLGRAVFAGGDGAAGLGGCGGAGEMPVTPSRCGAPAASPPGSVGSFGIISGAGSRTCR